MIKKKQQKCAIKTKENFKISPPTIYVSRIELFQIKLIQYSTYIILYIRHMNNIHIYEFYFEAYRKNIVIKFVDSDSIEING